MALNDCKIKDEDFNSLDIESLSDRPSADGMSAQALKERFDAGTKRVVKPKYNQLIEMLTSQEGADNIGITPIEGVAGYTVQQILTAVKILLDDKQSIEQSNKDVEKKFDKTEAQALVKSINFTKGTGVFTITKYDGTEETIDTPIEKIPLDVRLDGQDFVLTLDDGTEQRVDISKFLTETEVKNSDTITLAIESGVIVARLASGSVTMAHLNPEVTAYIEAKEQSAANSAASASVSEQNALNSANSAEQSHQNAKTCQEQACLCATQAEISRQAAATSEANAKSSEQAAKQSETKSATSEEKAKASEEKAASSEKNASDYEQGALENAQTAEQAAEIAVNAMNNASASEQNAKASETASQTNKEASDTSASSAAESARAAAESAKRAEEEAKKAADIAGGDFVTDSELQAHLDAENPHNVTAEQTGAAKDDLSNVDNEVFQAKAEEAGLGGDFLDKEVYDPQGKEQDVFQYADDAVNELQKEVKEALNNALTNVSVNGIAPDENGNITLTAEVLSAVLADVFAKYLLLDGSEYMTGNLNIERDNPACWLINTTTGRSGFITKTNDNRIYIENRKTLNNRVTMRLYPENYNLAYLLSINRIVNGTATLYKMYGEHNITKGTSDIVAGTDALTTGCIHLVYK